MKDDDRGLPTSELCDDMKITWTNGEFSNEPGILPGLSREETLLLVAADADRKHGVSSLLDAMKSISDHPQDDK